MERVDLIPEWKVREACAKCMRNEKHARYFNNAPTGAKQYIALVFFETVFPNDLTEEVADQCFKETLQELNADDLLYLVAHEVDPRTRDVFVERLAFLREESALQRKRAENPKPAVTERPTAARAAAPAAPPAYNRVPAPVFQFAYDARRLDREVAVWNRRWRAVCVSLVLMAVVAVVCALGYLAISKGLIRVRHW